MRIVTLAMFAAFVFAVAENSKSHREASAELVEQTAMETQIDPIVTGREVSPEQLAKWRKQRAAYLNCPSCVASQPFPTE